MSNTKSMAAWLSTEHPELEDALGDALKAADRQYAASQPGYGKSGDALAEAGLLDSGYAAYLAGIAYAARQSSRAQAQRDMRREAASGYASYVNQKESERQSALTQVTNKLLQNGITDKNAAYTLALQYGLGRTDARRTAENIGNITGVGSAQLRRTVLDNIISLGMRAEYGKQYAMVCGLSEEEAERVAQVAEASYLAKNLGYSSYANMADYYDRYRQ